MGRMLCRMATDCDNHASQVLDPKFRRPYLPERLGILSADEIKVLIDGNRLMVTGA